ncbi:uncharacterized protein BDW70DRAFT_56537 [Aspergillus foveolatus]|uniref:uncharacterized protein n=1 Tax=Aspergillus foveolatus TaxID=210207 RepID=UPI003CCD9330
MLLLMMTSLRPIPAIRYKYGHLPLCQIVHTVLQQWIISGIYDCCASLWPSRLLPHLLSSENFLRVQWQLECQEKELRKIRRETHLLICQSTEAQNQHLVNTEKIQQQEQLLVQACSDAAKREE